MLASKQVKHIKEKHHYLGKDYTYILYANIHSVPDTIIMLESNFSNKIIFQEQIHDCAYDARALERKGILVYLFLSVQGVA